MKTRAGIALVFAALAAGCGSDSSTGPKASNTLELGAVLSQMEISDVNAIPAFSTLMMFTLNTAPPAITPSACSYSASAGAFTCPLTTVGDFTFKISYSLYDAAGQPQSAPDASTTAWVRLVIDATGNVPISGTGVGTDVVTDHEDMTLSGLLTPTRILNGTGTTHHDERTTGTVETYTNHTVADVHSTTAMLVLKAPGTAGEVGPTSGTITSAVTMTETFDNNSTVQLPDQHGVFTFNGTGLAKFVYTISGSVASTCTIDLSGKTATSCH